MPRVEGTSGFFIGEGSDSKKLLLVTARHVVFPVSRDDNKRFERRHKNQPRHNVALFGFSAFNNYLQSILAEIKDNENTAEYQRRRFHAIEESNCTAADQDRKRAKTALDDANEAIQHLTTFYETVSSQLATLAQRIFSDEGYTEDWAVIEIDASKVDAENFNGNAIDLGTRIAPADLIAMMSPNRQNAHPFIYPGNRCFRLRGIIPDEEMRHPTALDRKGERCLMVMKRGSTTGLTVGRANDICSYARYYYNDGKAETSKEWPILPLDRKAGAFSANGDFGAVIVDGRGRIGGLLTGGTLNPVSSDITYATPITFLLKRMAEEGLHEPHVL